MCINCWIEVGSPSIVNEQIKETAELIKDLYNTDDGGAGGYGHIVFDDWNVLSAEGCIPDAENAIYAKNLCEETRLASLAALKSFIQLTEDERYSCLALIDGFIN